MKVPIIVSANGDLYFYDSVEKAELDIEPTDVKNSIFTIYDSEGLAMIPSVVPDPIYDIVKIHASKETKQLELRHLLIEFFSTLGHDSAILKTMTLKELVKLGLSKVSRQN